HYFTGATDLGCGPTIDADWPGSNVRVIDDSTITTFVPFWFGAITTPYACGLFVKTPYGWSTPDANDQFTILPIPIPTITGLTPPSGPVGTLVTITGTNLTASSGTLVEFTGCGLVSVFVTATANPFGSVSAAVPACAQTGQLIVWVNSLQSIASAQS